MGGWVGWVVWVDEMEIDRWMGCMRGIVSAGFVHGWMQGEVGGWVEESRTYRR